MRCLIKDQRSGSASRSVSQGFQGSLTLPFLRRQKSVEGKRFAAAAFLLACLTCQSTRNECADRRVGARDRKHLHSRLNGSRCNLAARVGDARCPRIAHHCDPRPGLQRLGKLCRAARLVVHVVADSRRADAEVVQQLLGLPRIFTGDAIDGAQHTQRTQGNVLEIPDWRRHQVKSWRQRRSTLAILFRLVHFHVLGRLQIRRESAQRRASEYSPGQEGLRTRRRQDSRWIPDDPVDSGHQLARPLHRMQKITKQPRGNSACLGVKPKALDRWPALSSNHHRCLALVFRQGVTQQQQANRRRLGNGAELLKLSQTQHAVAAALQASIAASTTGFRHARTARESSGSIS